MAERVVKTRLSVQMQDYIAGMEKARRVTQETATEAQKLAETKRTFDMMGRASLAAGGLIAVGLGVAIAKYAEFDQAMSNVAATGQDARDNIDALTDAAIDAGASTVFSASEAAGAIENLAKAGLDASDIMGGALTGSLDLAAAGQLGVADAAEIAATTLQQFQLEGEDATHVADLLAAGAGKAMGDVSDMSQALKQSGLVANQFGISVEETVGTLSAFASAGLLGSDAGTSFRSMLLRLANPTEEVKTLMADLGIEAYNSQGQFIGLQGLAGELETSLAGMTDEQKQATLAMIFGQDAIRAATVLYEEGADGIAEWTEKVDDSGYAADVAAERLDNLKGDIEAFQGAFDSALIGMGEAADGPLRFVVQSLTSVVDVFNELPDGAQQAAFWVGAAGSAALTAYGSYLLLVPKVAEYNAALAGMGPNAQRAGRGLAAVGKGVGIVAAVGAAVTIAADALVRYGREVRGTDDAVAEATTTNQGFLDAMDSLGVTTEATADSVVGALDAIAAGNTLGPVGFDVLSLRDALTELDKGLEGLPLDAAVGKFQDWAAELGLSESQMSTLLQEMPGLRDAIRDQLTAAGEAADAQSVLNFAMEETPDSAKLATGAIEDIGDEAANAEDYLSRMRDELDKIGQTALTMSDAVDDAQGSLNALAEAAAAEETSVSGTNDASIAYRDTIRDVEQSHKDAAVAILENNGTMDEARAKYEEGREAIILSLEAKGMDRAEAEKWADANLGSADEVVGAMRGVASAVNGIPDKKTVVLVADTAPAMATINRFIFDNNGRRINLTVDGYVGRQVSGSDVIARADGGAVYGPGTSKSDSIPAVLSNGEHVLTAADVRAMGGQHAVYGFREALHNGGAAASMSLDGVAITGTLEIGGDGLARIIDGRIIQSDSAHEARLSRGVI